VVAVDRFAREIVGFLKLSRAARSRQLKRNTLGGKPSKPISILICS